MQFIKASDKYCSLKEHVPAPIFRKTFDLASAPTSAYLDIAVSGFYELYVNGENITVGFLAPYISNPDHLIYKDTYDIAPYLKEGSNAIAVILGNGFANQDVPSWEFDVASFRAPLRLAFEVRIACEGGDVLIYSDESVRTAPSAILFDMYRFGVIYDAREERDGFSLPEYDDSDWQSATLADAPLGKITPSRAVPIKVREELVPVSIERHRDFYCLYYKNGEPMKECYVKDGWVYDFGVNTAGVCRLKIKGERGQRITIRHAENLIDGRFDIGSTITIKEDTPDIIGYLQTDVYYLKGGEEEIFLPPFTYHGFRYALVEGITEEQATSELLTYVAFNTDMPKRSDFECSDEVLNKLYEMTVRADYSNFHHFPTDCPHREKNGWTGDASVSAHQLLLSFDVADALSVWLENARYAQKENGMLPGIIPTATWGYAWGSGPAWDAAIINLPYYVYKYDGRTDIIRDNADMIERYLRYISSRADERGLVACGLGDWCQPRATGAPISSPLEFTDSVQVLEMAGKSALMLDAIGRTEGADFARELEARMRNAIKEYLIDKENAIAAGACQTSQALAIRFGLFDECDEERAYKALIGMIKAKDDHHDCGMIGLRHIFHVLFENGDADLALRMITREDAPSYGNMIKLGGTALFESTVPNGLNESQNHHFFGDILHLFISKLVGIRVNPTLTDPKSVTLSPIIPSTVSFASASYDFSEGRLSVRWEKIADDTIRVEFSVPNGIKARLAYGENRGELVYGKGERIFKI